MHITINEGPGQRISMMQGQQLKITNEVDAVAIKVSNPTNNTYTGVLHLSSGEIEWLIRELPRIKSTLEGVSVFLDNGPSSIPTRTIADMLTKMLKATLPFGT